VSRGRDSVQIREIRGDNSSTNKSEHYENQQIVDYFDGNCGAAVRRLLVVEKTATHPNEALSRR